VGRGTARSAAGTVGGTGLEEYALDGALLTGCDDSQKPEGVLDVSVASR
jgi:hypothetical protein